VRLKLGRAKVQNILSLS